MSRLEAHFKRHPGQALAVGCAGIAFLELFDAERLWTAHTRWPTHPFLGSLLLGTTIGTLVLPILTAITRFIRRDGKAGAPDPRLWGVTIAGFAAWMIGFYASGHGRFVTSDVTSLAEVGSSGFFDVYTMWLCLGAAYLLWKTGGSGLRRGV